MKSVLGFLRELQKNNNRDWFKANKNRYDSAREDFLVLVDKFIKGIVRFDPEMAGTNAADCVFRIYRDIRFSDDKTPYKTAFGASMQPGGRTCGIPGYYVNISPGNCFLAGGAYMPPAPELKKIRDRIAGDLKGFRKIVEAKKFKELFGELAGEKLKTAPKGFPKDHEAIEYLRYKGFAAYHDKVSEKLAISPDFVKYGLNVFKAMAPLNFYMRKAMK
ncbi:MAG: DUF2461 domain-containing protein [Acidobacteriota bacterium]|nr:DUF2461 domain-containing protein [Acidobacteriota bacterium]MDH3529938.1 DUF2461 domain-containing protein [Acidobacteriota bacterium]